MRPPPRVAAPAVSDTRLKVAMDGIGMAYWLLSVHKKYLREALKKNIIGRHSQHRCAVAALAFIEAIEAVEESLGDGVVERGHPDTDRQLAKDDG